MTEKLEHTSTDRRQSHGLFPSTRWTMVVELQGTNEDVAFEALSQLCQMYWYPLYAFARRIGAKPQDAEDLTQGFFRELLEKKFLTTVNRDKGRLRSYLLVAFKHYTSKQRDRASAFKRGGGHQHLSIDRERAEARYHYEPVDEVSPEILYERHWALVQMEHARAQLGREFEKKGKGRLFEALKGSLSPRAAQTSFVDIAEEFAMSVSAVKMTAHRMRKRFGELYKEEIAHTVHSAEEIEDEINHLFSVFAK